LIQQDCTDYIRRVSAVTDILEGKWKLQVLCAMRDGPVRLSQLVRLLPSASKKALRACLRDLEHAHIVVRCDMSDTLLHVEYDFADYMRTDICRLLDELASWGDSIQSKVNAH
jgi:DNA-binding HxlR family transcriptional regulator